MAKDMLGNLGYEVEIATTGIRAIELFAQAKAAGTPFNLVILDLTLPGGIGGIEVLRQMQAIDPGVNAIVSSGYSGDVAVAEYTKHGFKASLSKPYLLKEMSAAVKRAMAGRS
jgi:CheY-like chemotaxis protein